LPALAVTRAQVRACAFQLLPSHGAAQLQRLLPFVGRFTAGLIHELLATGSCAQLRAYLQDLPSKDSRGNVRLETTGAPPAACCSGRSGRCQRCCSAAAAVLCGSLGPARGVAGAASKVG
jgi:hypothetical protein